MTLVAVPGSDETEELAGSAPPPQAGVERDVGLAAVLRTVLKRDETVRIGPYTVLGRLGAGGMGAVYRAWDPRLERTVALKLLLRADEGGTQLQHEAKALAKLKHPNVVAVYDVGEDARGGFVAMELVDGPTLGTWVESHPGASARAVVRMFVQAGRGLAAAHAVGVIHRDFKPDNAIVGSDGRVRVVDFGIARVHGDADAHPKAGTPNFMAPEQRRGDASDARTDQFALCTALRRSLDPEAGSARSSQLPRQCKAALERGLAEEPGDRWPSMDALLQALDPPARPRRWWLASGMLAASFAALTVHFTADHAPSCAGPRIDAAASWEGHNRASLAARLGRADTPGAPEFLRRMDATVASWSDARVAACGLLHTDDAELAASGARRLECLDLVAEGLDAFALDLTTRDDLALERAGLAMQALHRPHECAAPHETLVGSLPDRELLLEVQSGRVAHRLYDFERAVAQLTPAYERATAAGLHRLAATAALTLAAHTNDKNEQRRRWAERALESAEAAQNVDLMVRAWVRLSYTDVSSSPPGPWEATLEHAVRLGTQGSVQPLTAATLALAQANAAARTDRKPAALAHFDAAIDAYRKDGHLASAGGVYCDKAQTHAALGQMPSALEALDSCLDKLGAVLGETHPSLLLRLGIGMNISMIANDLERTVELSRRAIEVGRRGTHRARIRIAPYVYGAGAYTELGDFERALELLDEGLKLAVSLKSQDAEASIHGQFGGTLSESGDCAAALPHFGAALELAKSQTGTELIRGITFLNRAECSAKLGKSDAAMADVERAWEVIDLPETSTLRLSQVRLDAKISLYAGRLERAAERLAHVEERAEALEFPAGELAYALYLRARVEAERQDHALARSYIDRAEATYVGHTDTANRYREFRDWVAAYDKRTGIKRPSPP